MQALSQAGIAVFGVTAIWLSQHPERHYRKFACIAGLMAQPFWLWTTIHAQQWGIVCMSAIYTYAWWRGVKTYWLDTTEK